ncbi:MAG: Nif3-like dinuclear metal center hexameric protein [Promethearchaeota archaeon]
MLYNEIKSLIEKKFSPKVYRINSEFYGLYYGQANNKKHIKRLMFTIDLNLESIHYAIRNKINLIISLHGLSKEPITNFNQFLINKLMLLSKYPLLVFILNSSFIAAEGGISDTLMECLYLKLEKPFNIRNDKREIVPIGRICLPNSYTQNKEALTIESLLKRIKSNLNTDKILYVGESNTEVNRICIVGRETVDLYYLRKALKNGCDCFISGNISHRIASYAKDTGLSLIGTSLYSCNTIALKKMHNLLSLEFPNDDLYFFEAKNPVQVFK